MNTALAIEPAPRERVEALNVVGAENCQQKYLLFWLCAWYEPLSSGAIGLLLTCPYVKKT